MADIKKLGQERVLQARAFDICKVLLKMPDEQTRTYDLVDHRDAVAIVPINSAGEVLFIRQYRVGAEAYLLEIPAGLLDENESPEETAMRELREETGMAAHDLVKLGGFYMTPGYSNEFLTLFLARDLYPAPLEQDDDEYLKVEKIPLSEALIMAQSGELRDGKSIAGLFLAEVKSLA